MWYVIAENGYDLGSEPLCDLLGTFFFRSRADAFADEKQRLLNDLGLNIDGDNSACGDEDEPGWYQKREAYIESPDVEAKLGDMLIDYNGARIVVSDEKPDEYNDDW